MKFLVVAQSEDSNYVARLKFRTEFIEPLKKAMSVKKPNPFGFGELKYLKPFWAGPCKLDQSIDTSAIFDIKRIEVDSSNFAAAAFIASEPPRIGHALPTIHDEVNTHLWHSRTPFGSENWIAITIERVAQIPAQVGGLPFLAQLAILLALLGFGFVEG